MVRRTKTANAHDDIVARCNNFALNSYNCDEDGFKTLRSSVLNLCRPNYGHSRAVYIDTQENVVYKFARDSVFTGCNLFESIFYNQADPGLRHYLAKPLHLSRGHWVLAMEYVPYSLDDIKLSRHRQEQIINKVISQLRHVFYDKLPFYDIRPDNLRVDAAGQVKIVDYGDTRYHKRPSDVRRYLMKHWANYRLRPLKPIFAA